MNWTMIFIRGSLLPAAVMFVGFFISIIIVKVSSVAPAFLHFAPVADWVLMGATAIAAIAYAVFVVRMFRWERALDMDCRRCGGPLGRKRAGVVMYGNQLSDYRRCYNCNGNTPVAE